MTQQHTRRLFLTAGSAGAVFGALGAAAAAEAPAIHDPTFDLIAEHRRLELLLDAPDADEQSVAWRDANERELEIHERLCTTPPTSTLGVIALAEYLQDHPLYHDSKSDADEPWSLETGVATIARALRALAGLPAEGEA